MSSQGKSVRLFLAEGTPGGLVTAEIMNWTGHALMAPRSHLSALMKRDEARRTGVYVLLGEDPLAPGDQKIYVGESDDVSTRLKSHEASKDFWDRVVVLTSKDTNLTKAHARYLESRLISIALAAKRSEVTNGNAPAPPPLPEADASDMEYYLSQAQILLPVLSVDAFRVPQTHAVTSTGDSPRFVAGLNKETWARATEVDGEFTVLENSRAKPWKGAFTTQKNLQDKLIADGTLSPRADGDLIFTHDQVFGSPSGAAAVVLGRNANGRLEWRVEDGQETYAQWQNHQLNASS